MTAILYLYVNVFFSDNNLAKKSGNRPSLHSNKIAVHKRATHKFYITRRS